MFVKFRYFKYVTALWESSTCLKLISFFISIMRQTKLFQAFIILGRKWRPNINPLKTLQQPTWAVTETCFQNTKSVQWDF